MSITIVSHQPQYFPHLELFNKILQSNKFVILDDVKFNNSAWHAKTIIKDNKDNIIQLIIPCSKINSSSNKIKDIKIFNDKWKKKHLKTLEQIFGKTKYFNEIYKVIFQILSQKSIYLIDYTIPSMMYFLEKFGYLKKNIFLLSEQSKINGDKNDFLINLIKKFDGDKYLSGQGAKSYIDEKQFLKNKIIHKFNDFDHPKYLQFGEKFIPKLSVVDAAFNIGLNNLNKIIL